MVYAVYEIRKILTDYLQITHCSHFRHTNFNLSPFNSPWRWPGIMDEAVIYSYRCGTFNSLKKLVTSPILSNHLPPPSLLDPAFQQWHRKGIEHFWRSFINYNFASFEQLCEKFSITNTHFFRYLQPRYCIHSQISNFPEAPGTNTADAFLSLHPVTKRF